MVSVTFNYFIGRVDVAAAAAPYLANNFVRDFVQQPERTGVAAWPTRKREVTGMQ